jgi:hypothetical protein
VVKQLKYKPVLLLTTPKPQLLVKKIFGAVKNIALQ